MKKLAESSNEYKVSGQLQGRRAGAGGREFQILGDATEELRAPNAVCFSLHIAYVFMLTVAKLSIDLEIFCVFLSFFV